MTRKLNPSKVERIFQKSKSRVLVPKKFIKHIGLNSGDYIYLSSLSSCEILTINPTAISKKYKIDKDGALRIKTENLFMQIFVADETVVLG